MVPTTHMVPDVAYEGRTLENEGTEAVVAEGDAGYVVEGLA